MIAHQTEAAEVRERHIVHVHWPKSPSSNLIDAKDAFFTNRRRLRLAQSASELDDECVRRAEYLVRATDPAWPKWKPSDPTSAHWYRPEHLARLIGAYIAHDQEHGRIRTVRELVAEFRGLSGTAKQKAVLEATGLSREPLTAFINGSGSIECRQGPTRLLTAMQAHSRPVKPQDLGVIGEEHFAQRFEAAGCRHGDIRLSQGAGEISEGCQWSSRLLSAIAGMDDEGR